MLSRQRGPLKDAQLSASSISAERDYVDAVRVSPGKRLI